MWTAHQRTAAHAADDGGVDGGDAAIDVGVVHGRHAVLLGASMQVLLTCKAWRTISGTGVGELHHSMSKGRQLYGAPASSSHDADLTEQLP